MLFSSPEHVAIENASALLTTPSDVERLALVPVTLQEIVALRHKDKPVPSMHIPLGLIDKPEEQQREIFLVDLHGSFGALTGGPLLICGVQHSGKVTALETLLLWLTTRHAPRHLRCAIVDPLQDLDPFRQLPHLQSDDGESLWTTGSTDAEITAFSERVTQLLARRQEYFSGQRQSDDLLTRLWAQGVEIPQVLVVISHFHSFVERPMAAMALKKLALAAVEGRSLGIYLVITSVEIGSRYLPADLMSKFSTKIGLFLQEQQRFELFGRTPIASEPVPGRGLALTPDRSVHQVQLALPIGGTSEHQRDETLKHTLAWLSQQ